WLALAWTERSPEWLTAAQAMLTVSIIVLTTSWIQKQDWYIAVDGIDPRVLQAYGITLGLLGLMWMAARRALRSSETARELFEPVWVPFDRVVLALLPLGT